VTRLGSISLRTDCPSMKVGWNTKAGARSAAATKTKTHGKDFGFYKCTYCRRWHLTTHFHETTKRAAGAR
jgi:hypothetical protein